MNILPSEFRVLKPEKDFGTEGGSGYRGGDYDPAQGSCDGISEAAAECEENLESDEVGEGFEEKVRVDAIGTEVQVDGEACVSEMD